MVKEVFVRSAPGSAPRADAVAREEPLEIHVGNVRVGLLMRSPGDDEELVRGFLLTEGFVEHVDDIEHVQRLDAGNALGRNAFDVVRALPRRDARVDLTGRRANLIASACGFCGRPDTTAALALGLPFAEPRPVMPWSLVTMLPDVMRTAQEAFRATGGVHAAGIFRVDGTLLRVREDIGRHNAVDKVVGLGVLSDHEPVALVVSGRAGFEIVQKAAVARIPIVVAVGAPSSSAVAAASQLSMALVGFVRHGTANLYTGGEWFTDP